MPLLLLFVSTLLSAYAAFTLVQSPTRPFDLSEKPLQVRSCSVKEYFHRLVSKVQ
jgi:hypothetical protein